MFLTYLIMMNIRFKLWVIKPLTWTYGLLNHFLLWRWFWLLCWLRFFGLWTFELRLLIIGIVLLILIDFTYLTWLWCWYHHLLNLSQPRVFSLSIPLFNLFWHMIKLKTLGIRIEYGKNIFEGHKLCGYLELCYDIVSLHRHYFWTYNLVFKLWDHMVFHN